MMEAKVRSTSFQKAAVLVGLALIFIGAARAANAALPRPDHVVIVIDENKAFANLIGNAEAPYINALADRGALFTESYALAHPSQPNYLMLFAGSSLGVVDNEIPKELPLTAPNLGAELIAKGLTFCGYSEDLPEAGFDGASSGNYARKHNPWVNWQQASRNEVPKSCNQPFSSWPRDLSRLPTVAFVIPNLQNDMHDGTIAQGSSWLKEKLDGYVRWAEHHNSLLIVTFDEDDMAHNQRIPTFFVGPMVRAGKYARHITHYEVLRTVEDFYGLRPSGKAAKAKAIDFCWQASLAGR
jgi:acid phosphatase